MNRSMEPDIESVFMSPAEEFGFLSSSIIKDIARHDGKLEKFKPEVIEIDGHLFYTEHKAIVDAKSHEIVYDKKC